MALFGSDNKKGFQFSSVQDPGWVKSASGRFHRFIVFDAEKAGLSGIGGIYAIWHGGVRPEWVSIGKSTDLAATFRELTGNEDIRNYNVRGGLFISWALIREDYWDGDRKYGFGGYYYDGRWRSVAADLAKHYGIKPGDKILDVGCGKGFLLYEFPILFLGDHHPIPLNSASFGATVFASPR